MKTIEIPEDIDRLHLCVQDKVALATMRKRRSIPNGGLVKELGLSNSGVRTMIRRFKQKGLIREFNVEGERQFEVLVDEQGIRQPGCQKVTKTDAVEIRQKVTPEPPPSLTPEERVHWKYDYYCAQLESLKETVVMINSSGMCGYFTVEFQRRIDQIGADPILPDEHRAVLLKAARYYRNHQVAVGYAVDNLPRNKAVEVVKVLQGATPDQMEKLYDRIQAEKALGNGGNAKVLLLDIEPPKTISLQAHEP